MGRHAAGAGVGVDPIVAAALDRRPTASAGLPRHGQESRRPSNATGGTEGGLGWPGEPHDGTGLGWPDGLLAAPSAGAGDQLAAVPPSEAPSARRRSGWRRLFGGASGERGTSAA